MNCRRATRLLSFEHDAQIPPRDLRSLHSHLVRCPECRRRRDSLAAVDATFQLDVEQQSLSLRSGFEAALHARLTEEQHSRARAPIARFAARLEQTAGWSPVLPRLAAGLAAAMLFLAFLILLGPSTTKQPDGLHHTLSAGHLSSLSVVTRSDGSLHATLADRSAPLRLRQRRDIP